jgi:hypothetical protein
MFRKSKQRSSSRLRSSHQSLNASIGSHGEGDVAMRGNIALNLGDYELVYEDGVWHSGKHLDRMTI